MANSFGTETPPAPEPDGSNALSSGALSGGMPPAGPAAPAPQAAQGQPGPAQQQPPTLSHEQVVAGLRHFEAIKGAIAPILQNPSLGKSNLKPKIIDSVAKLVAERFMTPAESVNVLSQVPKEPLLQMKWAKATLAQTQAAENAILDHYGATSPHIGTVEDHFAASQAGDREHHMDHIAAMTNMLRKPDAGR